MNRLMYFDPDRYKSLLVATRAFLLFHFWFLLASFLASSERPMRWYECLVLASFSTGIAICWGFATSQLHRELNKPHGPINRK